MERSEATWEGKADVVALEHTFGDFFEFEQERLLRLLWMVTGSLQEAEDIVQDAFLRVWERWHKVSTMESPTGYLHHAAMNIFRGTDGPSWGSARRSGPIRLSTRSVLPRTASLSPALCGVLPPSSGPRWC